MVGLNISVLAQKGGLFLISLCFCQGNGLTLVAAKKDA
jgi:hypothetical protein